MSREIKKKSVKCPVCGIQKESAYQRIVNIQNHIIARAKAELFLREFRNGTKEKVPHVQYIKSHIVYVHPEAIIRIKLTPNE